MFSLQGWGLIDLPLRASNKGWFIWSISSIWLVGPEIHPEEPDRPVNQTDKPGRVLRARRASGRSLLSFQALLFHFPGNGTRVGPTARIERAHSYRARSASKEDTCLLPPKLARCLPREGGLFVLSLRASNEGLLGRALREHKRTTGYPPAPLPNVRSKNCFVRVICCSMSACKSRAPAFQSSFV